MTLLINDDEGNDLDALLDSVLEKGLYDIGAFQGSLMLLNTQDNTLEIIKRCGPEYDLKNKYRRFNVGEGIAGWVVQHCQPFCCPDVTKEDRFKLPVGLLNFNSLLAVPIAREGRVLGVICADSPEVDQFNSNDMYIFSRLAEDIAHIIERRAVDTFISYTKQLKQLESLHEVGHELSRLRFEAPDELPDLLKQIATDAERVLEADLVTLYQYYEQDDRVETPPTMSGNFNEPALMTSTINPDDAVDRIVKTGVSHYITDIRTDRMMRAGEVVPVASSLPERSSFVDREGVKSSAGVCLRAGREPVGVMFINFRTPRLFSEEDKHVIETFATYAALAIQGARRFQEAMRFQGEEALHKASRMVAHRLRNVLPVISDELDWTLERGAVNDEGAEWIRRALEETFKAQRVVRDFEQFAQQSAFELPDMLSATDLTETLGEVARQNLSRDSLPVKVHAEIGLPSVRVNLDRISDDFANFVRDSERHKPSELRVAISGMLASSEDLQNTDLRSGCYIKLIYTDNGPGIPPAQKQRVFEPFYTTSSGSGLGLAITKHNATRHGGTVFESGKLGHGVQFELYLPIEKEVV